MLARGVERSRGAASHRGRGGPGRQSLYSARLSAGVVDLQETPAVPPFDPKGDVRLGLYGAGGTLIALGWALGVVLNVLLHVYAPAGGHRLLHVYFGPAMGPYAWATLGLGAFTGAFGVVLLVLARSAPEGPFVLPGVDV
jgi:hypothetical protein